MEKIIVVGKNSFLAKRYSLSANRNKLIIYTSTQPTEEDVFLDLINPENFDYSIIKVGDIVLLFAAISSPDICQNKTDFAYSVNVKGTITFIENIIKKGGKTLFFSSDVVYGQSSDACFEDSVLNPMGEYAHMKLEVERYFLDEENFKTFRLTYVFSKDDKFTSYLRLSTKNKELSQIYHPLYRTVIYIEDVIDAISAIEKKWNEFPGQICNICGNELVSRKDIAMLYSQILTSNFKFEYIEPSADFYRARPREINMKSLYFDQLLGKKRTSIPEAFFREFNL
jgi:dTDP-4-dehydrorhamnose reductase